VCLAAGCPWGNCRVCPAPCCSLFCVSCSVCSPAEPVLCCPLQQRALSLHVLLMVGAVPCTSAAGDGGGGWVRCACWVPSSSCDTQPVIGNHLEDSSAAGWPALATHTLGQVTAVLCLLVVASRPATSVVMLLRGPTHQVWCRALSRWLVGVLQVTAASGGPLPSANMCSHR
jgi:hypothetical protein